MNLSAVLFGIGLIAVLLGLSEAWSTLVSVDESTVAAYHFGSEAMLYHGGWQYSNPEIYGWSALVTGSLVGVACALFGLSVLRRSWRTAVLGLAVSLSLAGALWVGGKVAWQQRAIAGGHQP